MVSVRRRKLIGQWTGRTCSWVPLPGTPENGVREFPRKKEKRVSELQFQSLSTPENGGHEYPRQKEKQISKLQLQSLSTSENGFHEFPRQKEKCITELQLQSLSTPENSVPECPGQKEKCIAQLHLHSLALNQPVEVKEDNKLMAIPTAKKEKMLGQINSENITEVHTCQMDLKEDKVLGQAKKQKVLGQIDPENPMEVHTYLMSLKEDNKLDLGPMQINEKVPIKEWMEKCYPHIFRVFPQECKVLVQFADKSKYIDLLHSRYCLFLFAVRNVVSMDQNVSPKFVKSLGEIIYNLEMEGFDCRFIRSELIVVGFRMKLQLSLLLARKDVIAKRALNLEKELQAATTPKEYVECNHGGKQTERTNSEAEKPWEPLNKLRKDEHNVVDNLSPASVEREYLETVLQHHKKLLIDTETEVKRLYQVLDRINLVLRDKAAFPML